MKHSRTIIGIIAFCAAVFLVGCGEQPVSETSSSSVETSTSSVETSSSSAESSASSSDLNIENPMDINDILDPELNTIDTSKPIVKPDVSEPDSEPTTSSDTSSSEPTSDTHEPTSSEPTSSTSEPTSSSSNSGTTSSSKPTGETSKPTSSSSSSTTSKPSSQPVTSAWNPNAPGNKPGPYGGYYDANGALHCKDADMPRDSYGAPVKSFYREDGMYIMTKAEKDAARAEEDRLWQGGDVDTSGLDGSKWGFEF